jgi:hypothetical protein
MLLPQAVCTVDFPPTTNEVSEVLRRAHQIIYTHILLYNHYHEFHFVFISRFSSMLFETLCSMSTHLLF